MNSDVQEHWEKIKEFFNRFRVELAFITISIMLIGTAIIVFLHIQNPDKNITTNMVVSEKKRIEPIKKHKTIFVHIDGAVEHPDVYEVTEGARLKDLLIIANGLSEKADRQYFARNFNLAQILADQQKIYVPSEGEIGTNQLVSMPNQSSSQSTIISINSASQQELEGLPGVGPATAQKIISGRPYSGLDELVAHKVLGPSLFEKLKALITL